MRFACQTLVLLLIAVLLSGCTNYRTLSFRVVDLESGEPISGAMLVLEQGIGDSPFGPKTEEATTDASGVAQLRAEDQPFVAVRADATGYVGERLRVLSPHVVPQAESPYVGTVESTGPLGFDIRLLSGPQAIVTLLVPDDFLGVIELEYEATQDFEAGDRRFTVEVKDGVARLPAAPALDVAHRFTARRASGQSISGPLGTWEETEPLRSQVRLRGPIDGVRVPVYVIGNRDRFQRVMRSMYP